MARNGNSKQAKQNNWGRPIRFIMLGLALLAPIEIWLKRGDGEFWSVQMLFLFAIVYFVISRVDQFISKPRAPRPRSVFEEDIHQFGRNFLVGKTMDDYREKHPECFKGKRFIGCHECGDRSVWAKHAGNTDYGAHHTHLCRTCGIELWRSTLKPD